MNGRFISFEGGEGAGKSTQIRRLAERLGESGQVALVTREPGGTPRAEAIRGVLLSGAAKTLGPEAEALLFAAARADHVDRLIRPALARGEWVLSDRFFDSTRVYQGTIGGVEDRFLDALDRAAVAETRPDLTFILDIPVEVGLSRVASRLAASGGGTLDRFESDAVAMHERRRRAFLDIAVSEPQRCIVINADRPEDAIASDIWQAVSARLLDRAA
jgi:dTMP kinase